MLLLDGRVVAKTVKSEVAVQVQKYKSTYGKSPQLAVVNVGDDPASKIYLKNKERFLRRGGHSIPKVFTR